MPLVPLPERPLFSILMTNYNYAEYIGQAIESVQQQTYTHWELIIVDNGSTDRSCDVVEPYAQSDPRIRLIRQLHGLGVGGLNRGYRASAGHIVCILDSDDTYLPYKLERVLENLRRNADAGFLMHRELRIDSAGRLIGATPLLGRINSGWFGPEAICQGSIPSFAVPETALCLRREVAQRIFPLPEHPFCAADVFIVGIAPLLTCVAGVNEPLSSYRTHSRNDYNRPGLTLDSFVHMSTLMAYGNEAQRRYIATMHPELHRFIRERPPSLRQLTIEYICLRFARNDDYRAVHATLVARSEAAVKTRTTYYLFWRYSVYLPLPAFRFAVRLLLETGRLKRVLWLIIRHVYDK